MDSDLPWPEPSAGSSDSSSPRIAIRSPRSFPQSPAALSPRQHQQLGQRKRFDAPSAQIIDAVARGRQMCGPRWGVCGVVLVGCTFTVGGSAEPASDLGREPQPVPVSALASGWRIRKQIGCAEMTSKLRKGTSGC